MPNRSADVRALLFAHLPTRALPDFFRRLQEDGFSLDAGEDPTRTHWPSTAWNHSHVMCWMRGPRQALAKWEKESGVMGFTEDDGMTW